MSGTSTTSDPDLPSCTQLFRELLEEIQPGFRTTAKDAISEFTTEFFSREHRVTIKDVEQLLFNGKGKMGLLRACGRPKRFGSRPKRSSEMLLVLVTRLASVHTNPGSAAMFSLAIKLANQDIVDTMRLNFHTQSADPDVRTAVTEFQLLYSAGAPMREQFAAEQKHASSPSSASSAAFAAASAAAAAAASATSMSTAGGASPGPARDRSRRGCLFGRSLADLAANDTIMDTVTHAPLFLAQTVHHISGDPALCETVGIFRVAPPADELHRLVAALDHPSATSEPFSPAQWSVPALTAAVVVWLRELPEPLVPYALYDRLVRAFTDDDLAGVMGLVHDVPGASRDVLQLLLAFAAHLSTFSRANTMNMLHLSAALAPVIFRRKDKAPAGVELPALIGIVTLLMQSILDTVGAAGVAGAHSGSEPPSPLSGSASGAPIVRPWRSDTAANIFGDEDGEDDDDDDHDASAAAGEHADAIADLPPRVHPRLSTATAAGPRRGVPSLALLPERDEVNSTLHASVTGTGTGALELPASNSQSRAGSPLPPPPPVPTRPSSGSIALSSSAAAAAVAAAAAASAAAASGSAPRASAGVKPAASEPLSIRASGLQTSHSGPDSAAGTAAGSGSSSPSPPGPAFGLHRPSRLLSPSATQVAAAAGCGSPLERGTMLLTAAFSRPPPPVPGAGTAVAATGAAGGGVFHQHSSSSSDAGSSSSSSSAASCSDSGSGVAPASSASPPPSLYAPPPPLPTSRPSPSPSAAPLPAVYGQSAPAPMRAAAPGVFAAALSAQQPASFSITASQPAEYSAGTGAASAVAGSGTSGAGNDFNGGIPYYGPGGPGMRPTISLSHAPSEAGGAGGSGSGPVLSLAGLQSRSVASPTGAATTEAAGGVHGHGHGHGYSYGSGSGSVARDSFARPASYSISTNTDATGAPIVLSHHVPGALPGRGTKPRRNRMGSTVIAKWEKLGDGAPVNSYRVLTMKGAKDRDGHAVFEIPTAVRNAKMAAVAAAAAAGVDGLAPGAAVGTNGCAAAGTGPEAKPSLLELFGGQGGSDGFAALPPAPALAASFMLPEDDDDVPPPPPPPPATASRGRGGAGTGFSSPATSALSTPASHQRSLLPPVPEPAGEGGVTITVVPAPTAAFRAPPSPSPTSMGSAAARRPTIQLPPPPPSV